MAVIASKHEPRCKLCSHPQRPEIDRLLEMRSKRQTVDGVRVNAEYVIERLREMEVDNPTEDNIKDHWRKHCTVTTDGSIEAQQQAAANEILKILAQGGSVDINSDLDKLWAIGRAEIEARVSRGERSGITPDIMLRIAQEKTRRQHNETQDELLKALTGGIAAAITAPPKQIDGAEVVEVEAVEA